MHCESDCEGTVNVQFWQSSVVLMYESDEMVSFMNDCVWMPIVVSFSKSAMEVHPLVGAAAVPLLCCYYCFSYFFYICFAALQRSLGNNERKNGAYSRAFYVITLCLKKVRSQGSATEAV